jgi:RNA polymerase sigma factor (TIGR02999 family)
VDKLPNDVTSLLQEANRGRPDAQDALISAVYQELRRIAGSLMRMERPGHTLQPTALVNEAYLRLVAGESKWENRAHFFGAAARAMRRILVEHARQKQAARRGGGAERVTFADIRVQSEDPQLDLLNLDEALGALQEVDPRLVKVVELRYFAGCGLEETAELLGVSAATIKRDWNYARAWLYERMSR